MRMVTATSAGDQARRRGEPGLSLIPADPSRPSSRPAGATLAGHSRAARIARHLDRALPSGGPGASYLMAPWVTPDITQRWVNRYTMIAGVIAMRYDANATL